MVSKVLLKNFDHIFYNTAILTATKHQSLNFIACHFSVSVSLAVLIVPLKWCLSLKKIHTPVYFWCTQHRAQYQPAAAHVLMFGLVQCVTAVHQATPDEIKDTVTTNLFMLNRHLCIIWIMHKCVCTFSQACCTHVHIQVRIQCNINIVLGMSNYSRSMPVLEIR